jgi:hypothetical protein
LLTNTNKLSQLCAFDCLGEISDGDINFLSRKSEKRASGHCGENEEVFMYMSALEVRLNKRVVAKKK